MKAWRRWNALSWAERALVLQAEGRLIHSYFALPGLRFQPKRAAPGAATSAHPAALASARQIALAVNLAAAVCPLKVACLHRSWVLWEMLRRRGIEADIKIGARTAQDEPFGAHAWVECQGVPLDETPDLASRFSAFATAMVPAHLARPARPVRPTRP